MKIKEMLAPQNVINNKTWGNGNKKRSITIHETANLSFGAGARTHARLQLNYNSRDASWHIQVDDSEVIRSFKNEIRCWAAGTQANNESIHIEICVNADSNFVKAVKNAAEITKMLMKELGIPLSRVYQHNYWTGKNCPTLIRGGRDGVDWDGFKRLVSGSSGSISTPSVKPTGNLSSVKETSIIDYLNSKGISSSKENRAKLAKEFGVENYDYSAAKNTELLRKMRENSKPKVTDKNIVSRYKGNSIVDYLNSIGEDTSRSNRKKLAEEYGIKNYDYSAKKNIELLEAMRSKAKAANKPKPSIKRKKVTLPASSKRWGTYQLDVKPVKENIDWYLMPSVYGGLTYDILDEPYPNVVTIMTGRGKRNIYVGNDTNAILK